MIGKLDVPIIEECDSDDDFAGQLPSSKQQLNRSFANNAKEEKLVDEINFYQTRTQSVFLGSYRKP